VRINESGLFPSNTTTAAVLVEINPGGMREPHRYPNGDEWLYVIEVQARLGVFIGQGQARTFDLRAGDVGYVRVATGHYLENTGVVPFRFRNDSRPVAPPLRPARSACPTRFSAANRIATY
jgi:oxalate decarboxylase